MLRIRLQRKGKKGHATYRVVVAERAQAVNGKIVADIGYYNPHTNKCAVDKDTVQDWLSKGAQTTNTVHNLLINAKAITGKKRTSWRPKKKEQTKATADETSPKEPQTDAQ